MAKDGMRTTYFYRRYLRKHHEAAVREWASMSGDAEVQFPEIPAEEILLAEEATQWDGRGSGNRLGGTVPPPLVSSAR